MALVFAAASSLADTLTTPSYKIAIVGCDEYAVSCDTVNYICVSRKTGKSLTLTGRTVHTTGADGVTQARFLGYEFKSGRTVNFVGEDGELRVTQDSKVLVDERGTWKP